MKPYPKYKDSGVEWIGEVPEHWVVTSIGRFFTLGRGRVISSAEMQENSGRYPVYSSQTENNGIMGFLNSYDFDGEYVTWTTDGANAGTVFYREGKFNCTNVCGTMQAFDCNVIDLKFMPFVLNLLTKREVRLDINPKLMNNMMAKIRFLLPPRNEQTAIAAFLDRKTAEIDKLIANKERLIELYEEEKKAVINQAVTKGLDSDAEMKDSGVEWLGEVPAHWEVKRLRYIGDCQNGVSKSGDYFGAGFPFISYGDVYNKFVLPEQPEGLANSTELDQKKYSVVKGDVLFTRTSETMEEIGIASTCFKTIDQAVFSGFLIRFRPIDGILLEGFSKYYFRANIHRLFFVKEMNLVTRASLSQELLKRLPVFIPPIQAQEEIASYLDQQETNLNSIISKFKKQINLFKEYRTALISEAVTGKIQIK